jgi:hypothetical protein
VRGEPAVLRGPSLFGDRPRQHATVCAPAGYQHADGDQHAGTHGNGDRHADQYADALVQQPTFLPRPGPPPLVVAPPGRHLVTPLEGHRGGPSHNRSLVTPPPCRFKIPRSFPQTPLGSEYGIHCGRRVTVHSRNDVAIGVEREGDGGMAEHLRDELDVNALDEQDRRCGVAHVMESDGRQPNRSTCPLKPFRLIRWAERFTSGIAEHQIMCGPS